MSQSANDGKPHGVGDRARRLVLDNSPGGLCLSATVGESFFVETADGPMQIQIIETHGPKAKVRFSTVPGRAKPMIVREDIVRKVMDGARLSQTTEVGVAIAPFIQSVLSHVVEV